MKTATPGLWPGPAPRLHADSIASLTRTSVSTPCKTGEITPKATTSFKVSTIFIFRRCGAGALSGFPLTAGVTVEQLACIYCTALGGQERGRLPGPGSGPQPLSPRHRMGTVADAQQLVQPLQMVLHRQSADAEDLADLVVALAFAQPVQHFRLARRQRTGGGAPVAADADALERQVHGGQQQFEETGLARTGRARQAAQQEEGAAARECRAAVGQRVLQHQRGIEGRQPLR